MRKVILYAAQSLDGFIAEKDGSVAFLDTFSDPELTDHGYTDFYRDIDTTLMGRKTYLQVLGFDMPFPYADRENFVFTSDRTLKQDKHVRFIVENQASFISDVKKKPGKNIWLIGGSELNTFCLENDLIDEIWLFITPLILGEGIPLFRHFPPGILLKPVHVKSYASHLCLIRYTVEKQESG